MRLEASKTALTEEQDPQRGDSVFDFLYHDARRVASFLSQFDVYGSLTSLIRREEAERSKTSSNQIDASAGILGAAKAGGSHRQDVSAGMVKESAKTYDPIWANALTLLDYLDERGLISREIGSARLGQFVLATGDLDIRDLGLIQKVLALPSFKAQMIPASASPRDSYHKSKSRGRSSRPLAHPTPDSGHLLGTEIFGLLPHSIQARLHSEDGPAWCTLAEEGLVVSSNDLFLKHGVRVPGVWHVLGILDATPSNGVEDDAEDALAAAQAALPASEIDSLLTIATEGMGGIIDGLVPLARLMLGRRDTEFGVTPLLIFRETSSAY